MEGGTLFLCELIRWLADQKSNPASVTISLLQRHLFDILKVAAAPLKKLVTAIKDVFDSSEGETCSKINYACIVLNTMLFRKLRSVLCVCVREALAIVDEYKGKGNDACTLLCSLGSCDVYVTSLRKKMDQHQKQHRIIDQVKALQESEVWK